MTVAKPENAAPRGKRKPQQPWTEDDVARLKRLHEVERRPWAEIDAALGRKSGQSYNKYYAMTRATPRLKVSKFAKGAGAERARDAMVARDARAPAAHATITALVFGDPPPGRSALDQRRGSLA